MDFSSPVRATGSPTADVLTPRSKIAKMMADIDNGQTPSPPRRSNPEHVGDISKGPADQGLENVNPESAGDRLSVAGESQVSSGDESDESVRKPVGRAARRMLQQQNVGRTWQASPPPLQHPSDVDDREEDLYSATPMKKSFKPTAVSPVASEGGLFVSPAKSFTGNHEIDGDDEEALPDNPFGSKANLAKLVAQKRKERMQREEEERQGRSNATMGTGSDEEGDDHDEVDPEIERIMSDAARPTRKAGKKAMLEMERETQRIARQQALAHQMKVRKKFTTADLLARFNVRRQPKSDAPAADSSTSSAPSSDGPEPREPVSTPPSSPPTPFDRQKALVEQGALSRFVPVREDSIASLNAMVADSEDLPDIGEILRNSQSVSKAPVQIPAKDTAKQNSKVLKLSRLEQSTMPRRGDCDDSDDELDIVGHHSKRLKHFSTTHIPGKVGNQSKALHALKHLSRIGAYDEMPRKRGAQLSTNVAAVETQLRRRAKEQARQEQLQRIAELKAKGIEVQTTEEREREAEAFESLLEKARSDAETLRKVEKATRRAANGEAGVEASDDESEDDEYVASGSENEEMMDGEDEDEEENGLIDEAAEDSNGDEADDHDREIDLALDGENDLTVPGTAVDAASQEPPHFSRNPKRSRVIVDDDEDEDENTGSEAIAVPISTTSENVDAAKDPFAAFGFAADDSLMSPTQAFNATMRSPTQFTQEDSFDMLRRIAAPSLSSFPPTMLFQDADSQTSAVQASQAAESQRVELDWATQPAETQTPATPVHTLTRGISGLTETPGWEPTQDAGLPTPTMAGFANTVGNDTTQDNTTQSTVMMRVSESPIPSVVPRRGRLLRRQLMPDESDEEVESVERDLPGNGASHKTMSDAFREMARLRKEALTHAERAEAQKEMKGMMDEQAEESEDEYTGLGGDDYVAPETEEDKAMFDEGHVDVNVRQLAAAYAEEQRVADEAATTKLYKDLTTGALRRKQANMFDLGEDEDELAMRRRQLRQREEARKRKLLLQDDNIASLVEGKPNSGKEAFLKAIADDDRDEDLLDDFGDEEAVADATPEESQHGVETTQTMTTVLQETSGNKRQLANGNEHEQERPPTKQRRTEASALRKPASLLEVKESVSFLLDEPDVALFGPSMLLDGPDSEEVEEFEADLEDHESDKDSQSREQARHNDGGFAPNPASFDSQIMPPPRLPASQRRTKPAIVDRLSLRRSASSSSDGSTSSRNAWAASAPGSGASRTPSLLRRVTSAGDRGVSTLSRENSASSSGSGVKMGGSKKSSLAYQARAEEHKAIVEASKRRREENTKKIAGIRRQQRGGMLGGSLNGSFE